MRLDDRLRVTPSPALFGDLKALLGPGVRCDPADTPSSGSSSPSATSAP